MGSSPRVLLQEDGVDDWEGPISRSLHCMYTIPAYAIESCRNREDAALFAGLSDLAKRWLRDLGWEGADVLEEKVRTAESLLE